MRALIANPRVKCMYGAPVHLPYMDGARATWQTTAKKGGILGSSVDKFTNYLNTKQ